MIAQMQPTPMTEKICWTAFAVAVLTLMVLLFSTFDSIL